VVRSPLKCGGLSDDKVQLWDAATGAVLQKLEGYTGGVGKVAFSPDGKQVASSSWDTVRLWDAITGDTLLTLKGFDSAGTSHISGLCIRDEWITRRKVNLL
jgi:WD40 repeat protein